MDKKICCEDLGLRLTIPPEYAAFCTKTYADNPQKCIYYVERETWNLAGNDDYIFPSQLIVELDKGNIKMPERRVYVPFTPHKTKKEFVEIVRCV